MRSSLVGTASRRLVSSLVALALTSALAPSPLAGQGRDAAPKSGRISGKVLASEDAAPVSSAEVRLADTDIGTLSDLDGRYFLRDVPPGTYDLRVRSLGYATKTVTGVTVRPGETTELTVTMETRAVQVGDLTVSVAQARGSAASLLDRQRTATAFTDAVGSDQISRSPDSDAAEAARRISGVTLAEGKYVYVRGLGKRYSQTTLNGSSLPSPDPERSTVPLDLFPAGFLENLTTQKTFTPDQSGEFSGGVMEIETREFPDEFTLEVSVGTSFNSQSQFAEGFLSYAGGGTDFLGFDDGSRDLPDEVIEAIGGLGGERLPSDAGELERLGESFLGTDLTDFAPTAGTTPGNLDFGFSVGDRTQLAGKELGYFVAGAYANSFSFREDEIERKWRSTDFDPSLPEERRSRPNVDYSFVRGMNDVRWGGVGNFNLQLSPGHQLTLKTLYNRDAEDEARQFVGANREDVGAELFNERLRFVARRLAWGQLGGKHQLFGENRLEWRFSLAQATREEPGLRETVYSRGFGADPSDPFTLDDTGESARYLFTELTDDDLSGGVDWTAPLGGGWKLKLGASGRMRDRDFDARRFRWKFLPGSGITSLDSALSESSIVGQVSGIGEFGLVEIVEPGDNYTADDEVLAGYAMLTVPIGALEAMVGARVEDYTLDLQTASGSVQEELASTDVLPAANLKLSLSEQMNLRAAASRTLDRPEFRELAPFQFTEAASLRQIYGNPALAIAEVTNADLRWEWFPRPGEVISLSAFHKDFDRPIEQVFIATAGTAYSYQNAEGGRLFGAELGLRKRLDFVADWLEPVTFDGNVALIDSEVDVVSGGVFNPTNLTRDLEGQSPYTVNASLVYQGSRDGTQAGVYFNVFGERIVAAGGSGVPDIVEQPRPVLDFTLKQPLWSGLELELEAENLLDSVHRWQQSANGITKVQREYHEGRSFSASLSLGG